MNNIIAIIPAKETSERLPNKNILKIDNKELWRYSVDYAYQEGITPIVSTDSEYIINQCIKNNILYYRETVDDKNMCNCIDQVLSKYNCNYFILLQPTSPIRQKDFIKNLNIDNIDTSLYTANHIKIIGHIDKTFHIAFRDQDSTTHLEHFDGNILVVNTNWYKQYHVLFNDDSKYIIENIPYILQIDTQEEFDIIKLYLESNK